MKDKGYKFYLQAELKPTKATVALKKEVASALKLPKEEDKSPDVDFFTSIFVSSGTNLNNAHFLPSELVLADSTISGKAVDIEHIEDQIIGHIYKHVYVDKAGKKLELADLQNKEIASLDEQDLDIEIASVVYKTRFPEIAQEIKDGKFAVSMEAYYQGYSVKIGDTIMSPDEAQALGFDIANEELYGKFAKVVKAGETVDEGKIARVLRGICFSGVGIVENPANPDSIILETASEKEEEAIIFNYDNLENSTTNKVTSSNIDSDKKDLDKEHSDLLQYDDTVGICVNYSKELNDSVIKGPDSKVINTNWCSEYDSNCPTAGNATEPDCLRHVVTATIDSMVYAKIKEALEGSKIEELTTKLIKVMKSN